MDKGVYTSLLRAGRLCFKVSLFSTPLSLLRSGNVTAVALGVAIVTFVIGAVMLYLANKYSPFKTGSKTVRKGHSHTAHNARDHADKEE